MPPQFASIIWRHTGHPSIQSQAQKLMNLSTQSLSLFSALQPSQLRTKNFFKAIFAYSIRPWRSPESRKGSMPGAQALDTKKHMKDQIQCCCTIFYGEAEQDRDMDHVTSVSLINDIRYR